MIEIVSTRDSAKFRAQIEVEAAGNGSHPLPKSVDSHWNGFSVSIRVVKYLGFHSAS